MDHADLVAEINLVEKMTPAERLKHAKKRRAYQLKQYNHYEKKIDKEYSKKRKHTHLNNMKRPSKRHKKGAVDFVDNIKILEAAARNDVEEVRLLLMNNVDPNLTNEDGLTALHQCCIDESKELLALLLEYGADVNARDSELWTPLHAAATCGHIHLCEMLVNHNADLLAVNADGNMPYDICEDEDTLDFVENEMAKRGITQEQIDETRLITERQMLDDLKEFVAQGGKIEDIRDSNGVSPLHIAAANGYLEVGKFLLDQKIPVNIRDDDSWEPIHAAACWQQSLMLDLLVQYGADIDSKTKMHDTPFDICEDPDIKQKILDMKDELESKKKKSSASVRKSSRPNSRSASMRRSSMRGEKSALFMKEVKEEAAHFGLRTVDSNDDIPDEDDEDEEEQDEHEIANVNDVELIIDDMNGNESPPGHSLTTLVTNVPHSQKNGNHQQPEPGKRVIPPLRELGEGVRPRSGSSPYPKQPVTISSLLTQSTPSVSWVNGSEGLSQKVSTTTDGRSSLAMPATKITPRGESSRPLVLAGGKTKTPALTTTTTTTSMTTGKSVTPKASSIELISGHSKQSSFSKPSSSSTISLASKYTSKTNTTTTTSTITGSSSSSSIISSVSAPSKGPTGSNPKGPTGSNPKGPAGSNPKGPAGSNPKGPTGSNQKGPTGSNPKGPAPTVLKDKSKENADPSLQMQATYGKSTSNPATKGNSNPTGSSAAAAKPHNIPSVLNELPGTNNSAGDTPRMKPSSETRYPTGGSMTGTTLIDLKRQRMEKYNRSGASSCNGGTNNSKGASTASSAASSHGGTNNKTSSLDSEIQNMFLANVIADRSPAPSPPLGNNSRSNTGLSSSSGANSKQSSNSNLNAVGSQSVNNNNNTSSRTHPVINGNQQSMHKFSASSSVQVIGGDDEKQNCCIII